MYVGCPGSPDDFKGCTLILPAVSVGNIGQLSVDLLVTTLELVKVGYIHSECVLPVCGNDPFNTDKKRTEGNLATSTEVYFSAANNLVVVQQRAPLVKGKHADYCNGLIDWITSFQFDKVIMLTSSHAYERLDSQLQGSSFRYIATPKLEKIIGDQMKDELKWCRLENRDSTWCNEHKNETSKISSGVFIPGGGIAKRLYTQCCNKDISMAVLLVFCSEGDNISDALSLTTYLNHWLKVIPTKDPSDVTSSRVWQIPKSWSLLFGSTFDKSIY
ncbi:proteasome assembly chaperone 2-like [Saccoglossus kowalevskii]|uniref:Proteasome assembly chaperone 2 n=1 Tax=Saccoglossus kowalevskii TaxID=10224 RepID=A0ABM0H0R1_SACKO|nr:PREDICTED: proteasome assembly chaperone 2-like [Saccoglossus kowalevskii]